MTPLEQLFIRACKSKDPDTRVRSVYRRLYSRTREPSAEDVHITAILIDIADKFRLTNASYMITEMSPNSSWKYEHCNNYWHKASTIIVNKIRCTKSSDLEGLIPPAKFRERS